MTAKNLDEFCRQNYERWQDQKFWDTVNRVSMMDRLFPRPPVKPLTPWARIARWFRIRSARVRDAMKVLRGRAEILDDEY